MTSIFVIGNCQVEPIAYLLEHMLPTASIRSLDFSRAKRNDESVYLSLKDELAKTDIILTQPLSGQSGAHRIKQDFPRKTFVIGNLYFRGLHPDICYVGAPEDRFQEPSWYHSLVVLDAFKRRKSLKWACGAFTHENFERLGLFEAWDTSLEELAKRDAALDLPIAPLIDSYCRQQQGFLSINHPTIALMYDYLKLVFACLAVPCQTINVAGLKDPFVAQDVPPLHDVVAEHFALPFRATQHWMIGHKGNRFFSRDEYVVACYEAYKKADPRKLVAHSPLDIIGAIKRRPDLKHLVE